MLAPVGSANGNGHVIKVDHNVRLCWHLLTVVVQQIQNQTSFKFVPNCFQSGWGTVFFRSTGILLQALGDIIIWSRSIGRMGSPNASSNELMIIANVWLL